MYVIVTANDGLFAIDMVVNEIKYLLKQCNHIQVQLEPTTQWALLRKDVYSSSKYTSMLQATKDIFREEGLPVLFACSYDQFSLISSLASFIFLFIRNYA